MNLFVNNLFFIVLISEKTINVLNLILNSELNKKIKFNISFPFIPYQMVINIIYRI